MYIHVQAFYFEFNGDLPQILDRAFFAEIVSDDEVIYYWEPFWEYGAERPYEGHYVQLGTLYYYSLGEHHSGQLQFKDKVDENVFQAFEYNSYS